MQITPSLPKDGQGASIQDPDWGLKCEKEVTYTATGDGLQGAHTLFTVTGEIKCRLLAVGETTLVGAGATLEVGVAGGTAKLIAQTTAANITASDIWHDNAPDSKVEASSVLTENVLGNGEDIIQTVGTANITAGKIKFILFWMPLSEGANVVPA